MEENRELADLVQRFREAAAQQDPGWLQQQLRDLLVRGEAAPQEARPARRSRPPVRLSPQLGGGPGRRSWRSSTSPHQKKARTRGRAAASRRGSAGAEATEAARAGAAVQGSRQVCGQALPAAPRSAAGGGSGGAAADREHAQAGEEQPRTEHAAGLTRGEAGSSAHPQPGPGGSTGRAEQDGATSGGGGAGTGLERREAAPNPAGGRERRGSGNTAQGHHLEPGSIRGGSPATRQGWGHRESCGGRQHHSRPDEAGGHRQRGGDSRHGQGERHTPQPRSRSRSRERRSRGSQGHRHSQARSRRGDSMAHIEPVGARDHRRESRSRSRCMSHRHSCCRFSSRSSPCGSEGGSRARSPPRDTRPRRSHSGGQRDGQHSSSQQQHLTGSDRMESTVTAQGTDAPRGPGGCRAVVWLLGHSYVSWARRRAAVKRAGVQLGFPEDLVSLKWFSFPGLKWSGVLSSLFNSVRSGRRPDILIIHAGGNDLGAVPQKQLVATIKQDLDRIRMRFPDIIVVWSEIIPRLVWRHARDARAIEKCRKKVNKLLSPYVRRFGGVVVRHSMLEEQLVGYYFRDGVHLSEVGMDIFILALCEGIERALVLFGGARHA
ncbi:filaggrin-2-like isoform X2 [Xenopus tropicalis]|uniref:1-alkyl-2-acetylglycerophosphocholine esterase n=1 Tax=Xenopus tropicalis TaxID=8364 RepID=A0A8J1JJE2_XENTR|nr:filaggrin-2-like isoform X2 [Xenopus tropicalis]